MTTKAEIQDLLRFLTQDAKVPLKDAMPKVKDLQKANLATSASLAKSDIPTLKQIFPDEKTAQKILSTAKRLSKKRASTSLSSPSSAKKPKRGPESPLPSPAEIEASLALPTPSPTPTSDQLSSTIVHTNRAPLVLAFAVTLLTYTHPTQPLSSRLSLAQAVVSANSRSKAVSIGLERGPSAESEGWGVGQPKIRIMGREIRALKRWGYDPTEGADAEKMSQESDVTVKGEEEGGGGEGEGEVALWGLDLEALRSSTSSKHDGSTAALPIYTPHSALTYLLKSFASPPPPSPSPDTKPPPKKSAPALAAEKERNLAFLLTALDMLFSSWSKTLSKEELDRRAWNWYVAVRPEVESGVAGWGGRGEVRLGEVLGLMRKGAVHK